ncbi:MAG: DMT family transporter [Candidatus Freyarchaeota archaeon]
MVMSVRNKYSIAVFELVAASLIWGASFPAVKVGLEYLDPYTLVFLRFLLAAVLLIPVVRFRGTEGFSLAMRKREVLVLGSLNAAAFLMQFVGMEHTAAGLASLLVNVNVVVVAVLSFFFLGEKIGKRMGVAIALSLIGVALLTIVPHIGKPFWIGELLGNLAVLSAGVIWAFYIVLSKKVLTMNSPERFSQLDLTFSVIIYTALVLGAAAIPKLVTLRNAVLIATLPVIVVVFFMAVFCTIIAFILYFRGIEFVPASAAAVIFLLEVVFAFIVSVLFLGEEMTVPTLIGGVLIGVAVYLASVTDAEG